MSKVYRYVKNGGIEFRDESIPENGFAPKESNAWHTIKASGAEIVPYIKSVEEAWLEGAAFVARYFSVAELMMLLGLRMEGSDEQKSRAAQIWQWVIQLQTAALQQPATFNCESFPPPFASYIQTVVSS